MNLIQAQAKLRAMTPPGSKARLSWEQDEYGNENYSAQLVTRAAPYSATSLNNPGDAVGVIADQIASEQLRTAYGNEMRR